MKKRFSEEQIVAILRDAESGQKPAAEVCRRHGISVPTFYAWRRKFGSMAENERLKRLLAERDVELDVVRELLQKK